MGTHEQRINEIEQILHLNSDKYESMGSNTGILGLSLYNYYLYLYTNNEKNLSALSEYIEKSFGGFNEDYKGFSVITDTIEIGKYLHFLNRNKILDENPNDYLNDADTLVLDHLNDQLTKQNIDPVLGTISVGYYLLDRQETKDYSRQIEQILNQLETLALYDKQENIYWNNNFRKESEVHEIELGFTHGIAGIINFLLSVYEKKLFKDRCLLLINSSLNFLLKYKAEKGVNLFPFEITNHTEIDYQNLCYGDLGIGYVYLRSGKITGNNKHYEIGLGILKNSAMFKDETNEYIKDGNLLYGSAGLFSFFDQLTRFTNETEIKDARNYWYEKTLSFNHHKESPWAGYLSFNNQYTEATQLSFSEGICGIGITLISNQIKPVANHLSFLNYNF